MTNNNHAPWAPEPMAAASSTCVHQYEFRILGGHPITVPLCMLCGNPGWSDLRQQAVELYRWGWEEGRAGEAARTALSAYDRPSREAGEPGEQSSRTTLDNPATGRDAVDDQLRADANLWRHKAIRRALAISKLRGTIDACTDLADEPVTDPTPWGDGYRAAIEDLLEILREFGQRETARPAADRPREQQARPTHPDGTPYRYHEIVDEGWGFCDACRMWSAGTVEQPHQCRGAAVRAVSDDDGPSVAEAAADDRAHWTNKHAGGQP